MSADWQEKLRLESERWQQLGLISEHQRKAILGLYPATPAGGNDRTVLILSILGSLLVGAGVILYFAANWPRLPATVKVAAILAATIGSYAAGYHFQFRRGDSPRLGQALIFLGSLFYGAGIWLIAQIFHLNTDFPFGFLAWGAGILPLVWVTGSRPVLFLACVVLIFWTAGAELEFHQMNYLFPLLTLGAVFPLARRTQTPLSEVWVLLGLLLWYLLNLRNAGLRPGPDLFLVGRLILLYGSGLFLAGLAGAGQRIPYLGSGALLGLAGTYLLTFSPPGWDAAYRQSLSSLFAGPPFAVTGVLLILAGVVAMAVLCGRRGGAGQRWFLSAVLLPVGAVLLAEWLPLVPRVILFNILLLSLAVALVALGVSQRLEVLVNLGVFSFAVQVITRYFDLFFSAMDRSLFFILGGLLLLVGGWYLERKRRTWLGDWGGIDHAG